MIGCRASELKTINDFSSSQVESSKNNDEKEVQKIFTIECKNHKNFEARNYCRKCKQFICINCQCDFNKAANPLKDSVKIHEYTGINELNHQLLSRILNFYQCINNKEKQILLNITIHKTKPCIDHLSMLNRASDFMLKIMQSDIVEDWFAHINKLEFYVQNICQNALRKDTTVEINNQQSISHLCKMKSVENGFTQSNLAQTDGISINQGSKFFKNDFPYGGFSEIGASKDSISLMESLNISPAASNPALRNHLGPNRWIDSVKIDCQSKLSNLNINRHKMVYKSKFGDFGSERSNFTEPSGIASDRNNKIYIADTNNHRVQVFSTDGTYEFSIGGDGRLLYPNRVAIDPVKGNVVVSERSPSHQIQVFTSKGEFVRKFGSKVIQHPRGLTVDNQSRVIVVECKVMRVVIFNESGELISKFTCNKQFQFPNNVAVNDREEIFISDNRLHRIQVFSYKGALLRSIGHENLINYPIGVEIDSRGYLIVADNHNNFNITVFDSKNGNLIEAFESRTKHAQCYDITLSRDGELFMSSKDFRIYQYNYGTSVSSQGCSTSPLPNSSNDSTSESITNSYTFEPLKCSQYQQTDNRIEPIIAGGKKRPVSLSERIVTNSVVVGRKCERDAY